MSKPNRTCFGKGMCIHIGPCCDFWADDGMCVCNPADAAEYLYLQRLYVGANISGFSSPNIETVFSDGTKKVHTLNRGDYGWIWWNFGEGHEKVTFRLRDGGTVRAVRSTRIMTPDMCSTEGEGRKPTDCPDGTQIFREVCRDGKWVPSSEKCCDAVIYKGIKLEWVYLPAVDRSEWGFWETEHTFYSFGQDLEIAKANIDKIRICYEGEKRPKETCWDNSVTHEVCRDNRWVSTGETCPPMPSPGALRNPTTCWDGSVIHAEKFDADLKWWVMTGEKCPVKVCDEGDKRSPETCWDNSVIHKEICRGNKWVPTSESCIPEPVPVEIPEPVPVEIPKPECSPGDKKAGHVCQNGKWVPHIPPEQIAVAEEHRYIKFTIPWLDLLPGVPFEEWMWVPPLCEITTTP